MPARPGASLLLLCFFLAAVCGLSTFLDRSSASARTSAANDKITQGQLRIFDSDGKPGGLCPLKHTDVKAEVSGFLARVTLTQEFHNPMGEKIEAVYLFPSESVYSCGHKHLAGRLGQSDDKLCRDSPL